MSKKSYTILIVDDDSFVRDMLGFTLEEEGYLVDTAENGLEAPDKITGKGGYDLVISDMNMPQLDGPGLLDGMNRKGLTVPVIMLTGSDDDSVARSVLDSGAKACLVKDGRITEMIGASIAKILDHEQ